MGKSARRKSTISMATALQKAVAMYFLLHNHARGETDLTEDQLSAVVTGVCDEARVALDEARRCGLLAPVPRAGGAARAHGDPLPAPGQTVH